MNIDKLHRPVALENLLAGRIWPAGRRLPMHVLYQELPNSNSHLPQKFLTALTSLPQIFNSTLPFLKLNNNRNLTKLA